MTLSKLAALAILSSSAANADAFNVECGVEARTVARAPSRSALMMRRSFPMLRPSGFFSKDVNRIFSEMDELMDQQFFQTDIDRVFSEVNDLIDGPFMRRKRKDPSAALPSAKSDSFSALTFPKFKPFATGQYDISQDDTEFKLSVDHPGVEAGDLNVQLEQDGRVLRLSGERKQTENGMTVESHFNKAFVLDRTVDTSEISAELSDGVLVIKAPKKKIEEATEVKKIEVKEIKGEEATIHQNGGANTGKSAEGEVDIQGKEEEPVKVVGHTDADEKKMEQRDFPY